MTDYNTYYNTLANSKNVSRADVLLRCLVKAIRSKNEDKLALAPALIERAFTCPTNHNRIANGGTDYWGYHHARRELKLLIRESIPFNHTEYDVNMIGALLGSVKAPI